MKFRILSVLLLGLLAPAAWRFEAPAQAADAATDPLVPVAVLAIESYSDLLGDIGALGELMENPGITAQNVEAMLKLYTQGQGLKGLDTKRSLGIGIYTDGSDFQKFAFLPVENLKQLLTSIAPLAGQARERGGLIEMQLQGRPIFIKEAKGWAYVATAPEELNKLPADPGALLDPLTENYDVALQIHVANIPEIYRELAINYFKQAFDNGMRAQPNDDDNFEQRKKLVEEPVTALIAAINSTDRVVLGWALDQKSAGTSLEFQVTAKTGTALAERFSSNSQGSSTLTGLVPADSPLSALVSSKLSVDEQREAINQLTIARDGMVEKLEDALGDNDEMEDATKALVDELVESVKKTIKSGKRDMAGSIVLDDTLSVMLGAYVADPAGVDKAFKKFAAAAAKEYPDAPQPKFDAKTVAGVRFHTASIPIDDDDTAKVLGDRLDIALGIGPKHIYLALGKQGLSTLKKQLATPAAEQATAPGRLTVSVVPILKFVSDKLDDGDPKKKILSQVAAAGEKFSGKDHVRLTSSTSGPTLTLRLDAEENVIRLAEEAHKITDRAKNGG